MALQDPAALVQNSFLLEILETSNTARRDTFALLDALSAEDTSEDPQSRNRTLAKGQRSLYALVSHLRNQNRHCARAVRDTKAQTGASRAEVDQLHLSLQNLYYEQRHLTSEIAACENYDHTYSQLPLIPLQDFLSRFPSWLDEDKIDESGTGPEEQEFMRARIMEEHKERVELEEQRQQLLKRKLELEKANVKRKEKLSRLDKDLELFIDAAKPIEKTFEQDL